MRFQFLGQIALEESVRVDARGDQPALTLARTRAGAAEPTPPRGAGRPHLARPTAGPLGRPRPPGRVPGPILMVAAGAAATSVTSRAGLVALALDDDPRSTSTSSRHSARPPTPSTAFRCARGREQRSSRATPSSACGSLLPRLRRAMDQTLGGPRSPAAPPRSAHRDRCGAGQGAPARAVAWAEEALEVDPFDEVATRALMAAHDALGSRGHALTVYEEFRQRLDHELGVRPSEETEAAYLALLGSAPSGRVSVPRARRVSRPESRPCPSSGAKPSARASSSIGMPFEVAERAAS